MHGTIQAVVLLGHGSRFPGGNEGLQRMTEPVAELLGGTLVRAAFLQLSQPTLEEAVEECISAGARRITVVPFFLFPGVHVREDIPPKLGTLAARHPEIEFSLSEVLGGHPKLAEVVAERVQEVMP